MNNGQMIVVLTYSDETIKSQGQDYVENLAKRVVDTVNDQDAALVNYHEEDKLGNTFEKLVNFCPPTRR